MIVEKKNLVACHLIFHFAGEGIYGGGKPALSVSVASMVGLILFDLALGLLTLFWTSFYFALAAVDFTNFFWGANMHLYIPLASFLYKEAV